MSEHGTKRMDRSRAATAGWAAAAMLVALTGPSAQPALAETAPTAPPPQVADTAESGPASSGSEAPMPGAVPVEPASATASFSTAAAGGATSSYLDQSGTKVFRVDSGFDLDQYLFADSSPLNASIDVDTSAGPVDAQGFPAPGNAFHGKFGRLTLRAFDVDEDYGGTDFVREIDEVRVNGQAINAFLSGADNQWSVVSFAVPLSAIRLPANPGEVARNDIEVLIDTGNGGQLRWAVEVDWVELRLVDQALPAALMHGITVSGNFMGNMRDFYTSRAPELRDMVITPSVTRNGSIAENAALMQQPLRELLNRTGSSQLNIAAHSMGGLNSRLYIAENPGVVRNLVMLGTPNGGSQLADILCNNRNIPFLLRGIGTIALDELTEQFGPCDGPDDGLYQLQESYVQDVFNKQVLDSHSVESSTIAGQGNAPGNILLDGQDDGTVSVDSVRYLRPAGDQDPNRDHPGLQTALRPAYERNHIDLAREGSEALPRSLCTLYRLLYRCDGSLYSASAQFASASTGSGEGSATTELATAVTDIDGVVVPAEGSTSLTLQLEAAEQAVVMVTTGTAAVTGSIEGAALTPTNVFGVPALAAERAGGSTTIRLDNASSLPVTVTAFGAVRTARTLSIDPPQQSRAGQPVAVPIKLTQASAADVVEYRVRNAEGVEVFSGQAEHVDGGATATFTPVTAGTYSVDAWVEGTAPRGDSRVVPVRSADSRIGNGVRDRAIDEDGDGDFDALLVDVPVTVARAGAYRVSARLATAAGPVSSTLATRDLPAGPSQVTLRFAGREIGESRLDGPFMVRDVALATEDLDLLDEVASLGSTAAYAWRSFEHASVLLRAEAFTDRGIDNDADGLFEALQIEGQVLVDNAGTYAVNGRLVDVQGTELGEYQTTIALAAGSNPLRLTFNGEAIGKSGIDGPYRLVDLSVYALGNQDALGYLVTAHSTAAYRNEQFVGSVVTFPQVRALIERYVTQNQLEAGAAKSLLAKFDAASAAVDRGQPNVATNQLEAFQNELAALPQSKISDNARATLLKAVRRLAGT